MCQYSIPPQSSFKSSQGLPKSQCCLKAKSLLRLKEISWFNPLTNQKLIYILPTPNGKYWGILRPDTSNTHIKSQNSQCQVVRWHSCSSLATYNISPSPGWFFLLLCISAWQISHSSVIYNILVSPTQTRLSNGHTESLALPWPSFRERLWNMLPVLWGSLDLQKKNLQPLHYCVLHASKTSSTQAT